MSDTPSGTPQQLRPDVELIRLQYEHFRTYLQRWETDLRPLHEAKERSREMAHAYTKMGIQTMFLLNGGAIIAFPTFAKMAGITFADHPVLALLSVGAFVTGLVLIAVTTIYAFLSMDADSKALTHSSEITKCQLNKEQDPQNTRFNWDQRRQSAEKSLKEQMNAEERLRSIAIRLGVGSCVAFCVGALLAAAVLSIAHS